MDRLANPMVARQTVAVPSEPEPIQEPARPASTASRAATPKPKLAEPDQTVRQTLESVILALIFAFTFRAFVIEPFRIPTGSMAPTLLGEHLRVVDPLTGYRFTVDPPAWAREERVEVPGGTAKVTRNRITVPNDDYPEPLTVISPMTGMPIEVPRGAAVHAGDRILVHKFDTAFHHPSRWDVIVFKSPQREPGPKVNFIKRLVGLPNESLALFEGDVYVRPEGEREFMLSSKVDPEQNRRWESVQRSLFQPVFDTRYTPSPEALRQAPEGYRFLQPWRTRQGDWYEPWPGKFGLIPTSHSTPGKDQPEAPWNEIRFDFDRVEPDPHDGTLRRYPYNQFKLRSLPTQPIKDLRVAVNWEPGDVNSRLRLNLGAQIETSAMLTLSLEVDADHRITLLAQQDQSEPRVLADLEGRRATTRPREVEWWWVDGEALIWINRKLKLRWRMAEAHLALSHAKTRVMPPEHPPLSIELQGPGSLLHRMIVERDVYYGIRRDGNYPSRARGAAYRDGTSEPPVTMGPDQFFVLGDNPPMSEDSRYWTTVDPWISATDFPQPLASREERVFQSPDHGVGIIPGRLIVGQAFVVYFPAPLGWSHDAAGWSPNFGDIRLIR